MADPWRQTLRFAQGDNLFRWLRKVSARLPLRWRLALVSFGLLALLLSALGVLVSVTEEQALLTNQATALRDEAQLATNGIKGHELMLAAPSVQPPSPRNPLPDLNARAMGIIQRLAGASIRATVLSTDGAVIASSDNLPLVPPTVTPPSAAIMQALTTAQATDMYTLANDSSGQRQLVVLLPLVNGPNTVALLQLSTPTAPIDRSIATMRLILALGIVGALGIAAALTLPLVGAALSPLIAMERASTRIADGALSLRLDVPPSRDEIGRLARSFNSMVARLETAFVRQKRFVADVSHELRTPLTALGGGLEMLLLGADRGDIEASRRLVRGMYAEVGRMQRLVEDLLTLTRIDEGRIKLRNEVVDVGVLVSEVCEQAQRLARNQDVQCKVESNIPSIRGDADRLRQALLDIVDNALKFTPASGQVELVARAGGVEYVVVEVHDTGVGIAPEALLHVFDRFYRADPARARTSQHIGGSGLGLAIAKGLVEAHKGTIEIRSTPDVGTTVTIRLPATGSM